MGTYNNVDIAVSPSGDMTIGANGDFVLTTGSGVLKQDVTFRMRTSPGEFDPHPELGSGLDEIIGEPNTRYTTKVGEAKIVRSLTYDGMVANSDLYVRGVPISNEAVSFYVFVNNGGGQLNVTPDVVFNMINGLVNIPGAQNAI
jgi:hypothetical protein